MARKSRLAESRDSTDRKSSARKMPMAGYQGNLYVDPRLIPRGMKYAWKRFATFNEPDEGNMQTQFRAGWRPVPPSRHPELTGHHDEMSKIFGTASEAPTVIKFKGLILCECPEAMVRERRSRLANANFQQMNSLPGLDSIEGAPKINESSPVMAERVRTGGHMDDGAIKQD